MNLDEFRDALVGLKPLDDKSQELVGFLLRLEVVNEDLDLLQKLNLVGLL